MKIFSMLIGVIRDAGKDSEYQYFVKLALNDGFGKINFEDTFLKEKIFSVC